MGFDPEKARQYRAWSQHVGAQGAGGFGGAEDLGGMGSFGGFGGLGDIFGDVFGGGRRGRGRQPRPAPGANVTADISVELLDALRGAELELRANLPKPCATCGGSGRAPSAAQAPCSQCGGSGVLSIGGANVRISCPACGGTGKAQHLSCATCGGRGAVYEPTRLKVRIPKGVQDGGRIRLKGKGEPGVNGGPPGDLILTVHVREHPLLRRKGDDLYLTVPITVPEAIRGGQIEVPTLEGSVRLTIPPGSQSGQRLRLRGKGAPRPRGQGRGDLYVELSIRVPKGSPKAAEQAADLLEKAYSEDVRADLRL
jgi:molecular chaperone DnaJ